MENTRKRWARAAYLPVLAVAVALVAAVSSWAANPVASATPSQSSAPAPQQIQDTQTTAQRPDGGAMPDRGPGGRGDCPEKDGSGSGSGGSGSAAPQSDAPQSSAPTSATEV